ncbi:MAG: type II toxin-antitoxin system death-on-curing family toxin [Magnetococcales bacterium]|nr:type II toxin-antitoxin system death-on-curing family toxin [Magnetococcales bacterium]
MVTPIWIGKEVVLAIHKRQLAEYGGGDGVRDEGLLESSLSRPVNRFLYGESTPTLEDLAASYAFGISRNHPFVDGNKRVAYVVCFLFLRLNGKHLIATNEDKFQTFLALACGSMDEKGLSTWIHSHMRDRE